MGSPPPSPIPSPSASEKFDSDEDVEGIFTDIGCPRRGCQRGTDKAGCLHDEADTEGWGRKSLIVYACALATITLATRYLLCN